MGTWLCATFNAPTRKASRQAPRTSLTTICPITWSLSARAGTPLERDMRDIEKQAGIADKDRSDFRHEMRPVLRESEVAGPGLRPHVRVPAEGCHRGQTVHRQTYHRPHADTPSLLARQRSRVAAAVQRGLQSSHRKLRLLRGVCGRSDLVRCSPSSRVGPCSRHLRTKASSGSGGLTLPTPPLKRSRFH